MCNHIAIMNRGRLVEVGTKDDIYNHPMHIYTERLLAAIPETNVNQRKAHHENRLAVEKKCIRSIKTNTMIKMVKLYHFKKNI